jgi:hypothetical protein
MCAAFRYQVLVERKMNTWPPSNSLDQLTRLGAWPAMCPIGNGALTSTRVPGFMSSKSGRRRLLRRIIVYRKPGLCGLSNV